MTAAFIRRLTLDQFPQLSRRADRAWAAPGPVVLTGANGAGKTNLIEAISLLAPGRGLRRATMEELAFSEGDGAWAVSAEIEGMLGLATLGTGIDPPAGEDSAPSRKCRIDRESVGSAAAFADHLRVVWLTPAMDPLFNGPASERRRFLDRLVLAVDAQHSSRVAALERSLALAQPPAGRRPQRSALARRGRARDRRGRGGGGGRARGNGEPACRRARRRARPRAGISARRDRARRLDGETAARSQRDRDRGPLPRSAERQPRARRRRRPHARRPASVRSRRHPCRQGHPGVARPRPASRRRC